MPLNLEQFERAVVLDPHLSRDPLVMAYLRVMQQEPGMFATLAVGLVRDLVKDRTMLADELAKVDMMRPAVFYLERPPT